LFSIQEDAATGAEHDAPDVPNGAAHAEMSHLRVAVAQLCSIARFVVLPRRHDHAANLVRVE
jgi:hypothetical protein